MEEEVQLPIELIPDYLKKLEVINKTETPKIVEITFKRVLESNNSLPSKVRFLVTHKSS